MARRRDGGVHRNRSARGYSPRVIVKFFDETELPYDDRVERNLDSLHAGAWCKLKERFPGVSIRPMLTSLKPNRIRQLVDEAVRRDDAYRPPNFLTYFVVDSPIGINAEDLVKAILAWKLVQTAYVDPPGLDSAVNAGDDPYSGNQGYLYQAPAGINAEFAWGLAGGDGAGQNFIDLEQGWTLDHEDLIALGASLLYGDLRDLSRPHGTNVLGVVCAVDNNIGGIGIAPNVGSVDVVSYYGYGRTRPDAIFAAMEKLPYGGVLLLEAQLAPITIGGISYSNLPIEALDAEFEAIRLTTALGITVVEAAGNGANDLDAIMDTSGNQVFKQSFRNSGAILVGAASFANQHACMSISNYGSRIDCYAWGERVCTCSSTTASPFSTNDYTSGFDGTSSASAIIAGAALVVQGIAEMNLGFRFSALQMRAVLGDPATGTASSDHASYPIGVMPDLRAIINSNAIGLSPDVYIRDSVADIGEPHTGTISTSPDIILRQMAEATPQAAFGEGSGTENSETLGSTAGTGQDHFIYVRVRNRGGSDAANVRADVFWSPVATLITPDLWTPVGSIVIPNVQAGNVLTVSNAIKWPAAAIPSAGHYCFVGLIGSATDPAPSLPDLLDWSRFQDLIRNNNNITWRNFNVVDNEPSPTANPRNYVSLPFLAPGAPDEARLMRLEVGAKLPEGSRALLEMPIAMYDALRYRVPARIDREPQTVVVPVNPHGLRSFGDMLFPAKSRSKLRLLVQIPKKNRGTAYEVFVRQMYEEMEVGRVTWRLAHLGKESRAPPRLR